MLVTYDNFRLKRFFLSNSLFGKNLNVNYDPSDIAYRAIA